jgi:hypothetical protein
MAKINDPYGTMSGDTPKKGQHNRGRKREAITAREAPKPEQAKGHTHDYRGVH